MEASLWCWLLVTAILSASHASSQQPAGIRNCLPPHIRKETEINIDYFIDGMRIDIPCIAKGDGKLIYTWTKSGQQLDLNNPEVKDRITMGPETGTLHITAREMDEGEYQCSVSNECGKSLSRKMLLLLAKSLPFPLLEKPADVRKVLGTYLKLECKPPETIPKPRLSWIIKANNTGDSEHTSTVQLNSRVTMDYEGNLHITSVRKEDEQEGKTYVCQAENLFTRSVNIGEDKRITVQGTKMSDQGVDLKWHSGNETLVMVGKRARMKCIFSGQPDPTISWSRLSGGELENSTRVTFDGNELIINQVQYKDAGDYQCTGRNNRSQDSKSHTFKLTVQAVPQWKSLPQHVSVGVEESASFNCDATGEPTPTVQWYINGRPYEDIPPSSRRDLRNNTLTFTTLETEDSQVIQCNASNKHGSIWADVYLYVQAMAPVFEQKPPEKLVVAERQDAIVTCLVLGKPKPRIMWYKGNQLLEQAARFTVMDNGNLHIQNISTKEAGKYRCVAENRFGKDQAEGEVIVRERTFIQTRPINDQVDYTNPHTFTCHASTDSKEMSNLRIHWLKDGELISPSDRIIIDSNQLTIKETTSKDTANYTCLAENGLDKDTATATLEVKAVPDAPLNVSVEECLSKRATIKWIFEDKMRNFDTMTKFIIEYTTEYKPDVWVTATSQTYPALTAKVDLSPYAKYKFRVKAVNAMGISDASQPTYSSCETPMFSPDRNPDNVHTDESSTGFLVVKWKPMDQIDLNGPNFRYEIEVEELGTNKQQTFVVDNYLVGEKRIPVDNIYRQYTIKVRAANQMGKAMSSPDPVTGFSGEAPPLVVPENFELDPDINVTATSAGFRWDPVDTNLDLIRGEFSGYKIRFWKAGEKDTSMHEHVVHSDPSKGSRGRRDSSDGKIRGLVVSLPSYADVEADVVVINKNFESNGSNVVNFSTPEGVPERVDYLEALVRGSHHFLIQWKRPREQNGIITGYQVSYQKINRLDFEDLVIAFDDLDPKIDRATLRDLQPDTQYRIYIRAKTAKGLGREYFIDVRTIGIIPSMAQPVVTNVFPGLTEANVTWEVSTQEKGSRHGLFYYIEYRKENTVKWHISKEHVDGQFWRVLQSLEQGTPYEVRVIAMAQENGEKQPSNTFRFSTAGSSAARASFFTAAWFIGMMVAIVVLILILIIICIIKRNRGDNYPVQEKERLRGAYNDDNPDNFNGFGKGDENGVRGGGSFDRDAEKVPLDEDVDSLDYGDDDASKFNEDGSFIGQYGRGEKGNEATNASSIV